MRVFKTKWFSRFSHSEAISDDKLQSAIKEIEKGLIDADLGGGVIKKRLAREGKGKSGGYRTIIAFSGVGRAVFVFAFSKSAKSNLTPSEVLVYREAASRYLGMNDNDLAVALSNKALEEVEYHG